MARYSVIRSTLGRGTPSRQTLFFPARNKELAELISLRSPEEARASVNDLDSIFGSEDRKDKRLEIARAVRLAANRAFASRQRKDLSDKEKKEFSEIEKIYGSEAEKMFESL